MADKQYKPESKDIWNAQAEGCFIKAKTDWFSDDGQFGSRLHLSFVRHSGMKSGCKTLDTIEIGIPMVKAGSDGNGNTGVTALGMASIISNGTLARMAHAAREKQKQTGSAYPDTLLSCQGGTPSTRSKDGKAEFRRFSIEAGRESGTYALRAAKCEGEMNKTTNGVVPKTGAQWSNITVKVSELYLQTLAETIRAEWTAFLTVKLAEEKGIPVAAVNQTAAQTPVQTQPIVQTGRELMDTPSNKVMTMLNKQLGKMDDLMRVVQDMKKNGNDSELSVSDTKVEKVPEPMERETRFWIFIDTKKYSYMAVADSTKAAVDKLQDCLDKYAENKFILKDPGAKKKLIDEILTSDAREGFLTPIDLKGENPECPETQLYVRVYEKKRHNIWLFSDNTDFGFMRLAETPEEAIRMARECFRLLKETPSQYKCADKNAAAELPDAIKKGVPPGGWFESVRLVAQAEGAKGKENYLNVRVMPRG